MAKPKNEWKGVQVQPEGDKNWLQKLIVKKENADQAPSLTDKLTGKTKSIYTQVSVTRKNSSAQLFVVPFSVNLQSLSLSSTAITIKDAFICIPPDTYVDSIQISFTSNSTNRGNMQISFVSDLGDGQVNEIVAPINFTKSSTTPTELLPTSGFHGTGGNTTGVSKPLYMRIKTMPENGVSTPWWSTVSAINGSIYFMLSDADRKWVNTNAEDS